MQGFVLKWHGHNFGQMFTMLWKGIANSQPEFECQPLSYNSKTQNSMFCNQNSGFFRFEF